MLMKGLYGRREEDFSLRGLLIGKMLVQALENMKLQNST